ncbi:MAG: GNAT family N-acetyltransferase [Dehalococcoidia bacterium]
MAENEIVVENNERAQRYETVVDGHRAVIEYRREGERITYLHTEVPKALEGRGIGSALARAALDDARAHNLTVVPICPIVREYIRRHSEYESLVQPA